MYSVAGKLAGLSSWKSFGSFFYKCFTGLKTYEASQTECEKFGGTLATKILREPTIVA